MTVPNILDKLKLDYWYMVFLYLGGVLFGLSVFVPVQAFDNRNLAIFFFGMLLVGVGEWINNPVTTHIKSANAYTGGPAFVSLRKRQFNLFGHILLVIGVGLIVLALLQL